MLIQSDFIGTVTTGKTGKVRPAHYRFKTSERTDVHHTKNNVGIFVEESLEQIELLTN